MVTRRTLDGAHPEGWVPEEKLTVGQALAAYTRDAARASFEEHRKGVLATGMLADLAVLDRDLTTIPVKEIREARVLATIVGGRVVFSTEPDATRDCYPRPPEPEPVMEGEMRIRTTLLVLVPALVVLPALAQEPEITFHPTELAPGLYMLEGVGGFAGGNLGLLMGEDGVVLIDDGLPALIDRVQAAIDELTTAPIEFLINTHVHGDHIGGNEVIGKEATIVAHDNLRRRLVADGMRTASGMAPAPADALPVVTFSDSVTFHLNGRGAFVFHVERAHTDGDAVIHFRDDNVIHAGDVLFNGMFPFIDLDSGGTVEGYLAAQKRILELADEATRIIPGHGPLAGRKDLKAAIDMLEDALGRVRELVAAGRTEDQILEANPLADYDEKWSWAFITTERMTRTLVRALGGS